MTSEKRRAYTAELLEVSARYESLLDREAIAAALGEVSREYREDRSGPIIEVVPSDGVLRHYRLTFQTPLSLERALPELVEMNCVFLPLDNAPPVMTEVAMSVCGAGVSREVQLSGRVVQQTPAGVAIEVFRPRENQRLQLTRLPEKMREARPAELAPVQSPGSAAPIQEVVAPSTPVPRASEPGPAPAPAPVPVPVPVPVPAPAPAPVRSPVALLTLPSPPRRSWRLEGQRMVDLLLEVIALGGHGILELSSATSTSQFVITGGHVVAVYHAPWLDTETMEHLLKRAGCLEESARWAVRNLIEREGISIEAALVELGFVSRDALPLIARTRIAFILGRLESLAEGKAAYYVLDQPPAHDSGPGVYLVKQVFDQLYKQYCQSDISALKTQHGQDLKVFEFRFLGGSPLNLDFLHERPGHQRLLTSISSQARGWFELQRDSELTEHQTLAFLLTLDALGCLERIKITTRTWGQSQLVEQIEILYAGLGRDTLFERLGLHWSAYDEEIEAAYRKVLEKLALKGLEEKDVEALAEKVVAVRAGADEAYAVLKTHSSRVAYRKSKVDSFAVDSAVESFLQQIGTAKMRRDIPMAVEYCQRILELKPSHAEARSDLNLLRPLLTSPAS